MLRIIKVGYDQKLMELSQKQREQITSYRRDRFDAEWPPLRVIIPARQQHDEEPGSPSRQLQRKLTA